MAVELDYCEYANDGLAQAAYVSSDIYSADLCVGGAVTASNNGTAVRAFDDLLAWPNAWAPPGTAEWIQYDFGGGNEKAIIRYRIYGAPNYALMPKDWTLEGSNDGIAFDVLDTQVGQIWAAPEWKSYVISNIVAYRYYKLDITDVNGGANIVLFEMEMQDTVLQCYSEDTIKVQGLYSLRGFAKATDSVNDTLTRTVAPGIDLTGQRRILFDIRASRTGSNIKIGIHDSGGLTTEITPNVLIANAWQVVEWNISGVADADKDDIDSIIITIVNAVAADNLFYIDNIRAEAPNAIFFGCNV